jgi:ArsR family transcriptional regulator
MEALIKALRALSDETRLRIMKLLLEKECCVCEIMQALNISQSRASRNLSALHDAGFLKLRKEGQWSLYSIDKDAIEGYYSDLVNTVRKALQDNKAMAASRERLRKAERVGKSTVSNI